MDVRGKMQSVKRGVDTATSRAITMETYHEVCPIATSPTIPTMDIAESIHLKLMGAVTREGAKLLDDLRLGELVGGAREKDRAAKQALLANQQAAWGQLAYQQAIAQQAYQQAIAQQASGSLGNQGVIGSGWSEPERLWEVEKEMIAEAMKEWERRKARVE